MRRIILSMCLLFCTTVISLTAHVITAQTNDAAETDCLPPNFLMGSQVRVVGSVEAGGLPVRERQGLTHEVIGFIPIDTQLVLRSYDGCEEGRNWFSVKDVPVNDELVSGYVMGDDGYHYWLEASYLCPNSGSWLSFWNYQSIVEVYPGHKTLIIATTEEDQRHPVLLNHYEIDAFSGALYPTDYPYADIVTRDLTDRLGITEFVFGEHSNNEYSLHVSPDGKKILYFVPATELDNCAHFCSYVEGFVADADGSNAKSLGEIPTEAGLSRIYWGTDGRIYFTHVTEVSPTVFTVGFCIEDNCNLEGQISDIAANYEVKVPNGSIVTTSPNGQYLAITPLYRSDPDWDGSSYIIDTQNGGVITLPDSGLSGVPIFWDDADTILYGVNMDSVVNKRAYANDSWLLEEDRWLNINLDFAQETYHIIPSGLDMTENTDIFEDNWFNNWVNLDGLMSMFLPVSSGLKCVSGSRG